MSGIKISNRTGTKLALNTLSIKMAEGDYDIYTTEATQIAVLSEKNKARAINTDTDYSIPANAIVCVHVPKDSYIKANKAIQFFKVS